MVIITEDLNFVILDKKNVACTVEDKSFKVLNQWELLTYTKNVSMLDIKRNKNNK